MNDLRIAVIGLGYVGFPLACLFSHKFPVVGFDCKALRVQQLLCGNDPTGEVSDQEIARAFADGMEVTCDASDMASCNVYIIAVPTPVDEHHTPDLGPLIKASGTVGCLLKRGDLVVYESTVSPGVTEEDCLPVLEEMSGLKVNDDFMLGYSPERINPGDKEHTVANIVKITSGSSPKAADLVDWMYNQVLLNGTYRAPSIRVAEAAKIIENTQRDVNIAFMNEITKVFNSLGLSVDEVLKAAGSKWNFLNFKPGLVGGHCIGIDPYYLIARAERQGVTPRLITEARNINETMSYYVATNVMHALLERGIDLPTSKILILGCTFKENCPDIRNTKSIDLYRHLKKYVDYVDVCDPVADPLEVKRELDLDLITDVTTLNPKTYAAVIIVSPHKEFDGLDIERLLVPDGLCYSVLMGGVSSCKSACYTNHLYLAKAPPT